MVKRLLNSFLNISVPSAFGHRLGILFHLLPFLFISFLGGFSPSPLRCIHTNNWVFTATQAKLGQLSKHIYVVGRDLLHFVWHILFFRLLPLNSLRSTHSNDDESAFDWRWSDDEMKLDESTRKHKNRTRDCYSKSDLWDAGWFLQLLFYLQAAAAVAAEHFRTSEGIVVVTSIGPPAFLKLGRVWILRRVEGLARLFL